MRKVKLHINMTLDGFIARPNGDLDWMTWEKDGSLLNYINALTGSSDTILLGRKMTGEFVTYWENVSTTNLKALNFLLPKRWRTHQKLFLPKHWKNPKEKHHLGQR